MSERDAIRRELVGLVERPPVPIETKRRQRRRAPSAGWWLTRANRGMSCDDCGGWLREDVPLVFCAIGPRRLCRACARRRGITWRVAKAMRRKRRPAKDVGPVSIDARAAAVLDALRRHRGVVTVEELRAATGLGSAALGGELLRLKALGLASRHGRRGWSARGGSRRTARGGKAAESHAGLDTTSGVEPQQARRQAASRDATLAARRRSNGAGTRRERSRMPPPARLCSAND